MDKHTTNIGALLTTLCKTHRNLASEAMQDLGVHVGQEMVIIALAETEQSLPQSVLVEHLCVEPPTVTRMLQRMEKSGLIERTPDAEDGRVSRVTLTETGRSLYAPLLNIWQDLEARLLNGMNEAEQVLFRRLLMQAYTNLVEGESVS